MHLKWHKILEDARILCAKHALRGPPGRSLIKLLCRSHNEHQAHCSAHICSNIRARTHRSTLKRMRRLALVRPSKPKLSSAEQPQMHSQALALPRLTPFPLVNASSWKSFCWQLSKTRSRRRCSESCQRPGEVRQNEPPFSWNIRTRPTLRNGRRRLQWRRFYVCMQFKNF